MKKKSHEGKSGKDKSLKILRLRAKRLHVLKMARDTILLTGGGVSHLHNAYPDLPHVRPVAHFPPVGDLVHPRYLVRLPPDRVDVVPRVLGWAGGAKKDGSEVYFCYYTR